MSQQERRASPQRSLEVGVSGYNAVALFCGVPSLEDYCSACGRLDSNGKGQKCIGGWKNDRRPEGVLTAPLPQSRPRVLWEL